MPNKRCALSLFPLALLCASLLSCAAPVRKSSHSVASWYGPGFHGKLTSSGERYDMHAMTCAHKELPFGTRLRVTNVENGHTVNVLVNDRGPFVRGRDIDLSYAAAKAIGLVGPGTGKVSYKVLGREERYKKYITADAEEPRRKRHRGYFTIQVGAFEEDSNAAHLKTGLELAHDRVHIRKASVNGKRFYRVRVGKFGTYESALDYAQDLAEEGYSAVVMTYE